MASTTVERIDASPRGESLKTKIKSAAIALRDTIVPPPLPAEVKERIEFVKSLPPEEIDRQLLLLVDGSVDRHVDGELPPKLVREISRTAHTLIETIPDDSHTDQTLAALARAADDTGEHALVEVAYAIATEQEIPDGAHPHLAEALEHAATRHIPFREAYASANSSRRKDIPMQVREKSVLSTDTAEPLKAHPVAMTEYEHLFHPTIKRPNTPEYTSGGIHASLKR